jgi:hypothetical protein
VAPTWSGSYWGGGNVNVLGWQTDLLMAEPVRVSWKFESMGLRFAPKMAIS